MTQLLTKRALMRLLFTPQLHISSLRVFPSLSFLCEVEPACYDSKVITWQTFWFIRSEGSSFTVSTPAALYLSEAGEKFFVSLNFQTSFNLSVLLF